MISGMEAPIAMEHDVDISIRKISNGFVIKKSWDKDGKYYHEEYYSKEPPDLEKETFEKGPFKNQGERGKYMAEKMKDSKEDSKKNYEG